MRRYLASIASMRSRCFTLLLAFVAWFVVPAAPRALAVDGGPATQSARAATSTAAFERAADRSDRRARPEHGNDAVPGATTDVPLAALALAPLDRPRPADLFLPRARSSAQPRGPPVA